MVYTLNVIITNKKKIINASDIVWTRYLQVIPLRIYPVNLEGERRLPKKAYLLMLSHRQIGRKSTLFPLSSDSVCFLRHVY